MDKAITDLFAASAGPVKAAPRKDRSIAEERPSEAVVDEHEEDEEVPSADEAVIEAPTKEKRKKQKRKRDDVLLEDLYMSKLAASEEPVAKKATHEPAPPVQTAESDEEADDSSEDAGSVEEAKDQEQTAGDNLVHESHQRQDKELSKAQSTVFCGNLPTTVITSHTTFKQLKALFSEYGRVSSIRFRSIAFSELLPRKVAFVQGKFHPERDTVNAYIVYKDAEAARKALALNGQVFLEKHIRVDSVAHPAAHENKKCVFVGSLPFEAEEEPLWKHFGVAGEIESVRIIRDRKTNVGKGFAYVQFKDASSVQNALLLNEKKLGEKGRKLRVTRATKMPSKHKAEQKERDQITNPDLKPRDKAKLGRVKNLMGSQAAAKLKLLQKELALEGERASKPDGTRKKKKSKGSLARSKARAAVYRKVETAS